MTNEELLAEAKRKYPVGTKLYSAIDQNFSGIIGTNDIFYFYSSNDIVFKSQEGCVKLIVYHCGKWAEIISLPKDIKYDYSLF